MCFFGPSAFFSLPAAGLSSCSRLRSTQGARRNTTAQVWALGGVRGTCSGGSKSQVPTGRHSERLGPSRPQETHVQVKRMSDGWCDIWDLECHQCRHVMEFFSPTPTCQTCDHFKYSKINLHDVGRMWSLLAHMTTRWLGLSPASHSCTSIIMCKVNNSTQQDCCTSMI